MGAKTGISWAYSTWSPWYGCTKVSSGCKFCYAENLSSRFPDRLGVWGPQGERVVNRDWKKPLAWDRGPQKQGERRRVFPSMCDVFEDREDLREHRKRFWDLVDQTPNLDWLVLTKRPQHIERMSPWGAEYSHEYPGRSWNNVWLGVSVEDQETANQRIPLLLDEPLGLSWISAEPLLGPIDLTGYLPGPCKYCHDDGIPDPETGVIDCRQCDSTGISQESWPLGWVVVGGESGTSARPCETDWIRDIVAQCHRSLVPVYVKQLGAKPEPREWWDESTTPHVRRFIRDPKGAEPSEWPEDLRVQEFPR